MPRWDMTCPVLGQHACHRFFRRLFEVAAIRTVAGRLLTCLPDMKTPRRSLRRRIRGEAVRGRIPAESFALTGPAAAGRRSIHQALVAATAATNALLPKPRLPAAAEAHLSK